MFSAAYVRDKTSPVILAVQLPIGSQIVNASSTDRVWISQSQGMASGNGTPLDPLASMETAKVGNYYAILDAGAAAPVTVLVTDELNGYSNPVALAAAVATKLLASGIPIVEKSVSLYNANIPGNNSITLDVSQYKTVSIFNQTGAGKLVYSFIDANGISSDSDIAFSNATGMIRIAVTASQLVIVNQVATPQLVSVSATTRPAIARYDSRTMTGVIDSWLNGGDVMVAGLNYGLSQSFVNTGTILQGQVYLDCGIDSTTCTGYFVVIDAVGNVIRIMDTTEMTVPSVAATKRGNKMIALPPVGYTLQFRCRGTGSGGAVVNVNVNMVACHF